MAFTTRVGILLVVLALRAESGRSALASAGEETPRGTLRGATLMRLTSDGRVPVRPVAGVVGRWVGQDDRDRVGALGKIGPNGVQDIRIALGGLPRKEVTGVIVKGHGADQWLYPIADNLAQFAAVLDRKPGAPTAELYIEPLRVETGREFYVKLTFADGSSTETYFKGGKADPNRRTSGAAVAATWVGQSAIDHAGLGPGVGPDGLQDARIDLARLSKSDKVLGIVLESPTGTKWAAGINPDLHHNAEFATNPQDPTRGTLLFQPDRDLGGSSLTLTILYENNKSDRTTLAAKKTDPAQAMPAATTPPVRFIEVSHRWHGQDPATGEVRLAVAGVPIQRPIQAVVLSDGVRSSWVHRNGPRAKSDAEPEARPLSVRKGAFAGSLELAFIPDRDLDGQPLTLRFAYEGDGHAVATIAGVRTDPTLAAAAPDRTEATARPGSDLQALVDRFGTVTLAPGRYPLTRPLVLNRPVRLVGGKDSVLEFRQGPADPPWTAAIKIHHGGTTLQGFRVWFPGPIRWRPDVSWGPAVIGTTDHLDEGPRRPKRNLVFDGLDLSVPPASRATGWEEAPKLLRLLDATHGRIVNNTLVGGPVEFFGGPWVVEGNLYRGTPANTFSPVVFAAHKPHDLIVRNNVAKPEPLGGKTWRFLLLTNRGFRDRVEGNRIEGIGPRDDDTIPAMNSPEIILTESYHVRFEGKPAAVSADRRVVRVARLRGEPPVTGDVISVLSGEAAGFWTRIAQRIDETTYLLDRPLPNPAEVISIAPGFVEDVYEGNTIDARGGRAAAGFVLAGNHYGTLVRRNRVAGAGDAFQLMAFPSETPVMWGWTHAPYLGGRFEENVIEDAERGAQIGVLHNGNDKTSRGRTYMTIGLKQNVIHWTDAFLARSPLPQPPERAFLPGINFGWPPVHDPRELVVTAEGDRVESPPRGKALPAFRVIGAVLNGDSVRGINLTLPLSGSSTATLGAVGEGRASGR